MKHKIASLTIFILALCFGAFTFAADSNGNAACSFSFEYSIAKDCTYKSSADGNQISTGVVVDNGNRIFLISRAEGNTISGVWEKIHKK